jgi:starch-binding outer membrane protein, SusD/RagB family
MKRIITSLGIFMLFGLILLACKDSFLEKPPQGSLNVATLKSEKGLQAVLVGAYSALDGWTDSWGAGSPWPQASSNWIFGSIAGGDAYKGSEFGDQGDAVPIERYEWLPTNPYFDAKWKTVYNGVARANSLISLVPQVTGISKAEATTADAEGKFLRAHFHFEAKKMWNNVPYVDENAPSTGFNIPNDKDIWPLITADLKFAADNLPATQPAVGRANKWAAKSLLAKVLLYQKKYSEAKAIFDDVIANGVTSDGKKYGLNDCFQDNFLPSKKNSKESVFAYQASVNDGNSDGQNGNWGDILNFPYSEGPGTCCGFHQPSQSLVNSYKVDKNGLPLVATFNDSDLPSDEGVDPKAPFTPTTELVDPRLDYTVGRRGIPYLDWGLMPGSTWVRNVAYGPYVPKKNVYSKKDEGSLSTSTGWTKAPVANNQNIIRFADVLLMAAEAEVEAGTLAKAQEYVNIVRKRAAGCTVTKADGKPAANYKVATYDAAWTDKDAARKAVYFERKIELAMEGHRFFDLVRWGIAGTELNAYMKNETRKRQYFSGKTFADKNNFYPIPLPQINASANAGVPTLKQNPGF